MAEFYAEKRVIVFDDPALLAEGVASRFLRRVAARTAKGKTVHIALTGGSAGTAVLEAAGRLDARNDVDWSLVHFWWGDERYVPRGHADRNDVAARSALLDVIDAPAENIHSMAASDDGGDAEDGARAYAGTLARFGTAEEPWPSFDVCFLGVGPDAHIASLFPDRAEIKDTDSAVLAVRDSPKPPAERITLTRPVINSSQRVWLVLAGPDKASALGLALAGASYQSVPAAGAKGRKRTIFFVDRAAASQVPDHLIEGAY